MNETFWICYDPRANYALKQTFARTRFESKALYTKNCLVGKTYAQDQKKGKVKCIKVKLVPVKEDK